MSGNAGVPPVPGDRLSGNGAASLLEVEGIKKHYPVRGGVFGRKVGDVRAVDGVTFSVMEGETLGLVGESGCGKSTLGRLVVHLEEPSEGTIRFQGKDMVDASREELFGLRRDVQIIFQDPYSSLNPRLTVGEIVREPLLVHRVGSKAEQVQAVQTLLEQVGLSDEVLDRYPHEFSGGQRQRIGIARALALNPKLVVADEPASALDVSVQSQVLNLMTRLQRERRLTYLFISHDLSVVRHVSDSVAIMYLGKIVEKGPVDAIFERPAHPYTRALLQAVPLPDPRMRRPTAPLEGEAPSPVAPPSGCPFHPRCPFAVAACTTTVPPLDPAPGSTPGRATEHVVACIRAAELPAFSPAQPPAGRR